MLSVPGRRRGPGFGTWTTGATSSMGRPRATVGVPNESHPIRSRPIAGPVGARATMAPWAVQRGRTPSVRAWHRGSISAVRAPVTGDPAGVTLVSAPAGSGKTVLLRSWIDEAGLRDRTSWVTVERQESDSQRFWLSVVERLRAASGTDGLIEELAPTPEFDGEGLVQRLTSQLDALASPVMLVIDDLHELVSAYAQAELELLLARRPRSLYVVLATRHDPSLGLHRLRLAGELTEFRAADLRLSVKEARELLDVRGSGSLPRAPPCSWRGPRVGPPACGSPRCRWRAPGPRAVRRGLCRQRADRRRLPARRGPGAGSPKPSGGSCSAARSWSGSAARWPTASTGASGSERTLLELEDANAFVVSIDAERSWFRYHPLFADLLLLELRRSEPDAIADLHRVAAEWLAEHGHPSTRSVTPRPPATGSTPGVCSPTTASASRSTGRSRPSAPCLRPSPPIRSPIRSSQPRRLRRADAALPRDGGRLPGPGRATCLGRPRRTAASVRGRARRRPAGARPPAR